MRIKHVTRCALITLCVIVTMGCGSSSPTMLVMPEGTESVNDINFAKLRCALDNKDWYCASSVFFDSIYDYRLPDMVVYRDKNDYWRSGISYQGMGNMKSHESAQRLFDEHAIWVMMLSDIPPSIIQNSKVEKSDSTRKNNKDQFDTISSNDSIYKFDSIIDNKASSVTSHFKLRREITTLDTSKRSKKPEIDTIGYSVHRTSLAFSKPAGDMGLSQLISIAASLITKAAPPTGSANRCTTGFGMDSNQLENLNNMPEIR